MRMRRFNEDSRQFNEDRRHHEDETDHLAWSGMVWRRCRCHTVGVLVMYAVRTDEIDKCTMYMSSVQLVDPPRHEHRSSSG